jgi:Fe-S oxidoreductase
MRPFEFERQRLDKECRRCGRCASECLFLQNNGAPGVLASQMTSPQRTSELAFCCSLCGLCAAVCPNGCKPVDMFRTARVESAARGLRPARQHRRLTTYEKIGMSRLFSLSLLPENCSTVFFPGCALPGIRPSTTLRTFRKLQELLPDIGIVLDCCGEPSRTCGLDRQFQARLQELMDHFTSNGIKRLVLACPGCLKLFGDVSSGFEVTSVYQLMAQRPGNLGANPRTAAVHDSCITRDQTEVHDAVRSLLNQASVEEKSLPHNGSNTLCCGECGAVKFVEPDLAENWRIRRLGEIGESPVVTYCAACLVPLSSGRDAVHLLDLLVSPDQPLKSPFIPFPPLTYLNRLRLKFQLLRHAPEGSVRPIVRGLRR